MIWAYLYACIAVKVTKEAKNGNIDHHPARHGDAGNAGGFEQNVTTECVPDAGSLSYYAGYPGIPIELTHKRGDAGIKK